MDWFWPYLSNIEGFILESLIILSNPFHWLVNSDVLEKCVSWRWLLVMHVLLQLQSTHHCDFWNARAEIQELYYDLVMSSLLPAISFWGHFRRQNTTIIYTLLTFTGLLSHRSFTLVSVMFLTCFLCFPSFHVNMLQ